MNNKNNSQSASSGYKELLAGSLRTQSKLTVFMVHKLIQKRDDFKTTQQQEPSILRKSHIRDYIVNNRSIMRQIYSSKHARINIKQNSSNTPKSLITLSYKHVKTQPKSNQLSRSQNRHFLVSYAKKSVKNEQQSNHNNQIMQKIKKNVKNKNSIFEGKSPAKGQSMQNFGLNITQIKGYSKSTYKQDHQMLKLKIQTLIKQQVERQFDKQEEIIPIQKSNNTKKYKRYKMKEPFNNKKKSLKLSTIVHHDHKEFLRSYQFKNLQHSNSVYHFRDAQNNRNFAQIKMKKMNDCLDIILNSFHCRLNSVSKSQTPQKTYQKLCDNEENKEKIKIKISNKKYLYYLSPGNNSNLIRSLLKKRSWWAETDNIKNANFVWSQLKNHEILNKMQLFEQKWDSDVILYEEEQPEIHQNNKTKISDKRSISASTNEQFFKLKDTFYNQIFHHKHHKKYFCLLSESQSQKHLQQIQTPKILHNHYQHNYMLGNKNALYYNISMYYQLNKKELSSIVPITFHLERSNPRSIVQFQKYYNEAKKKDHIWIVKPAQNSNRGNGIEVTTSLSFIKSKLKTQNKLIVQSYIKNLLLYNGRKFDIRVYILILTINGRLKCFWYTQGYIRTSSQIFDLDNLNDVFIHLTNDAIQKKSDSYGMYEEGNKLSYSQFQRYLQSKYPNQSISIYHMHEQMKQLALDAIKATYCRIQDKKKQFGFELFGLDFIISSNFKPFLIQVNTNPCLELSSPVLERLIPRMMQNLFRISIDTLFRPNGQYIYSKSESYYIYDESFLQRNKFTLIFDQKFDRHFQWQQQCGKMRGIQWKQGQEQEYQDQGALIVIDY